LLVELFLYPIGVSCKFNLYRFGKVSSLLCAPYWRCV